MFCAGTVDLEPCQLKELSVAADILEMSVLKNNCLSALEMQKEMGNINETGKFITDTRQAKKYLVLLDIDIAEKKEISFFIHLCL